MERSATRSAWYQEGLQFGCTKCGLCCRREGYVWVDRRRIRAIARALGLSVEEFGRRYLRRVGSRYSLTEKGEHECVFWDDGCRIYPVRPEQCRTFPFWKQNLRTPAEWTLTAGECEGIGQGRLYGSEEIVRLAEGRGETG